MRIQECNLKFLVENKLDEVQNILPLNPKQCLPEGAPRKGLFYLLSNTVI